MPPENRSYEELSVNLRPWESKKTTSELGMTVAEVSTTLVTTHERANKTERCFAWQANYVQTPKMQLANAVYIKNESQFPLYCIVF